MDHNYLRVEKEVHKIKLNQLGARVKTIEGALHYVTFSVGGIEVKYSYHINDAGEYLLQRITPYPVSYSGICKSQNDVIDIIEHDISKWRNAEKSKKFLQFIDVNKQIDRVLKTFDDLYLYYNISHVQLKKIVEKLDALEKTIYDTKDASERVYFGKDPEVI